MCSDSAIAEPKAPLAGRYRFLRGVSSTSWLAWDPRSERRVLIGLVPASRAPSFASIRSIDKPHVTRVLELQREVPPDELPQGCEEGLAAIVTELATGRSLAALVQQDGPLTTARAVAWTLRVARSLQALHEAQLCHQAISPAAIVDRAIGRPIAPVLTWLRAAPLGPALSPEVLTGREPQAADDVWSLCVALYFALTGSYPFEGGDSEGLLRAQQNGPAPLARHGIDDAPLQKLFDLALAREPRQRLTTIQELIAALDAYELGQPLPALHSALRPSKPGLGLGQDRTLSAGLVKAGPLHASLDGVVFDPADAESAALADLGPEPSSPQRSSIESPIPARNSPVTAFETERISSAQPRSFSLLPNPFQKKKQRWPLAVFVVAVAGIGAAIVLRPNSSATPPPNPEPVTAVAPATKPTTDPRPKLSRTERLKACTESYFEEDTFEADVDFEFVCQDKPLYHVARQLHELAEAKTDARLAQATEVSDEQAVDVVRGNVRRHRNRRPLGWYELLATAIVRRSCCSPSPPVELPKTQGWCAQLGDIVGDLAEDSARSADLSPRVKRFDRAVECLYANRTMIPYEDYALKPLDDVQRAALQNFLSLAAMSEAKRRKLE